MRDEQEYLLRMFEGESLSARGGLEVGLNIRILGSKLMI